MLFFIKNAVLHTQNCINYLSLFNQLSSNNNFHIITSHNTSGLGNRAPGKTIFLAIDLAGKLKSCHGTAIHIILYAAEFRIQHHRLAYAANGQIAFDLIITITFFSRCRSKRNSVWGDWPHQKNQAISGGCRAAPLPCRCC